MFVTVPVSGASTVIVIVALFVSGANLNMQATVPFWREVESWDRCRP